MATFRITTEDGTFDVDAADEQTAMEAVSQQSAQTAASQPKKEPYTGMILPWATDAEGNNSLAVPRMVTGIIDSAKDAISAPYRAMTGELPMTGPDGRTSEEAIGEGFNMATWVNPSSVAMGTGKQIARNFARANPSEGAQVAQAAQNIGVTLPRAITSDSVSVQNVSKKLSQTPIVGTPIRNASKKATEQLDAASSRVQDDLGTGKVEVAGSKLRQDIAKFATKDEPKAVTALYDKLKTQIDPNVRIQMSETAKKASEIIKTRAAADATPSKAVERLRSALMRREGKSYDELKLLREDFRALKDDPKALASLDMNQRHVNDLYDALTADLKAAAKAAGGDEGLKTFNEANNRSFMFHRDKKELRKILGEGADENMATRLAALASDNSKGNIKGLMLAKSKVSKDTWDELASTVVEDLARNPTNGQFTPDKFVTKWNKLSESGKKILFAPEQRQALEDIAKVSNRFKQMNEFANPSGTGGMVALAAGGGSALYGAIADPLVLAGTVLSASTGYGLSAILARPTSAKALADYAKAYEVAVKMPGRTSQTALANKAKALALVAANGNEVGASNLAAKLATVQQTAADQENGEQLGGPEGNPEADQAGQQFNDAYLQGRAF